MCKWDVLCVHICMQIFPVSLCRSVHTPIGCLKHFHSEPPFAKNWWRNKCHFKNDSASILLLFHPTPKEEIYFVLSDFIFTKGSPPAHSFLGDLPKPLDVVLGTLPCMALLEHHAWIRGTQRSLPISTIL